MKSILTTPFRPITRSKTSHRSSQGTIYGDMIKQSGEAVVVNYDSKYDPNDFDRMYVYHGNDWSGSLNIFGGIENWAAGRFQQFCNFKGEVISLGIPFPSYHELIKEKGNLSIEINFDNLEKMYDNSKVVVHPHKTLNLVLGDSHSICMYRPGWMVHSVPFKTLYGTLNEEVEGYDSPFRFSSYEVPFANNVEFYFGNIDIRHHLCRQTNPEQSTKDLVKKYVEEVGKLRLESASIHEPLPIENESRKIPKTGWYKGTPFYGDWKQRNNIRNVFIETLEECCRDSTVKLIKWTHHLLNEENELGFEYMEKPQSVHLSRKYYPHWTGGDAKLFK